VVTPLSLAGARASLSTVNISEEELPAVLSENRLIEVRWTNKGFK